MYNERVVVISPIKTKMFMNWKILGEMKNNIAKIRYKTHRMFVDNCMRVNKSRVSANFNKCSEVTNAPKTNHKEVLG